MVNDEIGKRMKKHEYVLFRGKRRDNNEWITGALFPTVHGDPLICNSVLAGHPIDEMATCIACEVDPDTVCAYTGLDDANGRQIFDGDILQFGAYKVAVFWNNENFQWQARKEMEVWRRCPEKDWNYIELGQIASEMAICGRMTTEIIGNIYDNPDFYKSDKPHTDEILSWDL